MLRDGLGYAFAGVAVLDAVAEFPSLVFACAGAAGNGGAADGAACEFNVGFNGGIAARIKNLPGTDICDDGE